MILQFFSECSWVPWTHLWPPDQSSKTHEIDYVHNIVINKHMLFAFGCPLARSTFQLVYFTTRKIKEINQIMKKVMDISSFYSMPNIFSQLEMALVSLNTILDL